MVPSLVKAGRSLASDSAVVSARMPSSVREHDRVALALRDRRPATTSSSKRPFFQASAARWWRAGRERVLLLAGEGLLAGVGRLGQQAHRLVGEGVPQPVVRHGSSSVDVAVLEALARLRQQVRRVGHRLHAAGDDDRRTRRRGSAGRRARWRRCPDRQTLLMVSAGTVIGMPRLGRGLAGGDLAGAGREDLAHDHVVDLVGGARRPSRGRP